MRGLSSLPTGKIRPSYCVSTDSPRFDNLSRGGQTFQIRVGRRSGLANSCAHRPSSTVRFPERWMHDGRRTIPHTVVTFLFDTIVSCTYLESTMRESFYIPTEATADAILGDAVARKAEAEIETIVHEHVENPDAAEEDRRDVLPCASMTTDVVDERSTSSREAMFDDYCLETAPSQDALALSCLLFTKEEEIKSLQAELDDARSQLNEIKSEQLAVESSTKLEETVETWNKELLSKQGEEFVMEAEIAARDNTILRLKEDLARSNRKVSELEVKLEFHDFKFVSFEKGFRDDAGQRASGSQSSNRVGRSYTEKLVSDLEEIEKLYMSAKQDFAEKVDQLQQECNEYKAKCASMENTAMSSLVASQYPLLEISDVDERDDFGVPKTFMRKKIKLLETELKAQCELTSCLRTQVEDLATALWNKEKKQKQEMHAMMRNKLSLESKVAVLQRELRSGSGGSQNAGFEFLEANMEKLLSEIARLEARLRTKERIISKLQEKLSNEQQNDSRLVEGDRQLESMLAEEDIQHELIPTADLVVVCEPLPKEFDEAQEDIFNGMSDSSVEDEPSI
jgi:hypothetical protein